MQNKNEADLPGQPRGILRSVNFILPTSQNSEKVVGDYRLLCTVMEMLQIDRTLCLTRSENGVGVGIMDGNGSQEVRKAYARNVISSFKRVGYFL